MITMRESNFRWVGDLTPAFPRLGSFKIVLLEIKKKSGKFYLQN
jgi:hypothetical protein